MSIEERQQNYDVREDETRTVQNPSDVIVLQIYEKAASCFWINENDEAQLFHCGD
jgi:hypothetical protein